MKVFVAIIVALAIGSQVSAHKHGKKWRPSPAPEVLAFNLACKDDAERLCSTNDEVHALADPVDPASPWTPVKPVGPVSSDDSDDSDDKPRSKAINFEQASCLYNNKESVQPSCAAAMTLRPAFFACAADMSTMCPELSEHKKQCFGKLEKKAAECIDMHKAEFSSACSSAIQTEWTTLSSLHHNKAGVAEESQPEAEDIVRMVMPSRMRPMNFHKILMWGAGMGAASVVGMVVFFSIIACCCAKRGRFHCKKGRDCQGGACPNSPRMATMVALPPVSEEGMSNIPYAQLPVATTIN